jgi:hypothetical protein
LRLHNRKAVQPSAEQAVAVVSADLVAVALAVAVVALANA